MDILSLLKTLETYRPVSFPAVPSLWAAILSLPPEAARNQLSSIRVATSGGASLPPWVHEKFAKTHGKKDHRGLRPLGGLVGNPYGALSPGRAPGIDRAAPSGHRRQNRGPENGRDGVPGRRNGGTHCQRAPGHAGVLEQPGTDGGSLAPGMALYRGPGPHGCGRFFLPRGPEGRSDHLQRFQRLSQPDRRGSEAASPNQRRRGHRRPGSDQRADDPGRRRSSRRRPGRKRRKSSATAERTCPTTGCPRTSSSARRSPGIRRERS